MTGDGRAFALCALPEGCCLGVQPCNKLQFLHDIFQHGKLKVDEGYKLAIAATLKRGMNVGAGPYTCRLIYTDRPVEPNMVPRWDLTVVLDAFTKSPFEPYDMASVELKFLTFKIVVLLSLASGTRQGEIHALDQSLIR